MPAERGRHEPVGVVLDQRDARVVLVEDAPREVGRNGEHAVEMAVTERSHGVADVAVWIDLERPRARRHRTRHLPQLDRRHAAVLIDHAELEMAHGAPERVAEDHELDDGHDQRHDDQRRTPPKPAELAFHDGEHAIHGRPSA